MGLDVNLPREIGARRMVHFGAFEADLQAGELRKYGVRIKVADQPFRVLELLLERPGRLVAREELKQHLWPADTYVDFDRGLNAAVKILRGALGDSPRNPRFIETVPKRGYRFVAPAKPAPRIHGTAEETPRDETASGASAPSQPAAGAAVVGQKLQTLVGLGVDVADSPQRVRIGFRRGAGCQEHARGFGRGRPWRWRRFSRSVCLPCFG